MVCGVVDRLKKAGPFIEDGESAGYKGEVVDVRSKGADGAGDGVISNRAFICCSGGAGGGGCSPSML